MKAQIMVHLGKGNYAEAHRLSGNANLLGAHLLDNDAGAIQVIFVFQGGPARLAGLAAGDIIEAINGKSVRNLNEFSTAFAAVPFAPTVDIRINRQRAPHVKRVIASVPASLPELAAAANGEAPPSR